MLDTRELAYNERLPRVEQSLAESDIDGMIAKKLEFDERLNTIEHAKDSLALATTYEFEMWGEITAVERHPALENNMSPEAQEVREKVRLLKGALQWNLDKDFKTRLWKIRKNLKQTGEALVETQRARRQVDESMREEPLMFERFKSRVYGLSPEIDSRKARVEEVMAMQRAFLQKITVQELYAQKQRLETYTVQARFALADIYDRSSSEEEVTLGSAQ